LQYFDTIHIDQYSIPDFKNRPIDFENCARFGGNVISALGADAANIYIKFGVDRQVDGESLEGDSKIHNVVVLNRSNQKEIAFGRIAEWIDLLDASGPDVVACQCIGTGEAFPTLKCLRAPRPTSRVIQFTPGGLSGPVACVGGLTHLYERWLVAAYGDAIYIYDVQSPKRGYGFRTASHAWIFAADLYGHLLYVRSVPFDEGSNTELPPIQIDLDRLPEG
jgi:hypothetical protein